MNACDLFISSSQWEGFSLVAAEAMACQRPIVATKSGGIEEVVSKFGILVNPKNPKALAKGIESSLKEDQKIKVYNGLSSREHIVNNFSINLVVKKWLKIYKDGVLS